MLNRVIRGQIPKASDFNSLIHRNQEAWINLAPNSATDQAPLMGSSEAVVCAASNDGATTLEAYQCALIRGQWQGAGSRNTLLSISPFAAGDRADLMAICLDEIPPEGVGRICVMGICWAQWDGSSSGNYATPGTNQVMVCGATGPAQILATDNGLILVRFPIASAGAGSVIFPPHDHQNYFGGGFLGGMGGGL